MMDWTDRHCRAFHRVLTNRARLYTEMLTAGAVLHGERGRLLAFSPQEHPLALQLGGADPAALGACARIAEDLGFDEVNLNVGCPSERVQGGDFGACLMREPDLVARCVAAMLATVRVPVTVKCRLGVDDQDPEESLYGLVDRCAAEGVTTFIVHARKAWLQGLSPRENREIPPLDHALVKRLKHQRPRLTIVINGGIASLDEAAAHLEAVDGVMLGRAAYHTPGILGAADRRLLGGTKPDLDPWEAVERHRPYLEAELARGTRLAAMTRHMLGLFHGARGARAWRRILTTEAVRPRAGIEVVMKALAMVGELEPA